MKFKTTVTQKKSNYTDTKPTIYIITCYGEGTKEECDYILKLLNNDDKKLNK